MISCLKLRNRQKLGLCGIFSLGALTIIISIVRYVEYMIDLDLEDTVGGQRSPPPPFFPNKCDRTP